MPAIARASSTDRVFSFTGTGKNCGRPVQVATGSASCEVYANGSSVVRMGDAVGSHAAGGCGPDMSTLSTGSSSVFIGGNAVGRIGDEYSSDNIIISGSPNVFVG